MAIAKSLWQERDKLARQHDIAPSLLLSDSSIIEAATRKPHNAAQFRALRSLNERVRIRTGTEQDKMFERYAPIQRAVKPKVWKEAIDRAMALRPSQWPEYAGTRAGRERHSECTAFDATLAAKAPRPI